MATININRIQTVFYTRHDYAVKTMRPGFIRTFGGASRENILFIDLIIIDNCAQFPFCFPIAINHTIAQYD